MASAAGRGDVHDRVLYYASPNAKLRSLKSIFPGAVLAVVVWLVASAAFAFYVANFGSYNKTYGTLGGIIVFLVWMWITNVAILLGAEINAERERSRQLRDGAPGAEREIQLAERSEPESQEARPDCLRAVPRTRPCQRCAVNKDHMKEGRPR